MKKAYIFLLTFVLIMAMLPVQALATVPVQNSMSVVLSVSSGNALAFPCFAVNEEDGGSSLFVTSVFALDNPTAEFYIAKETMSFEDCVGAAPVYVSQGGFVIFQTETPISTIGLAQMANVGAVDMVGMEAIVMYHKSVTNGAPLHSNDNIDMTAVTVLDMTTVGSTNTRLIIASNNVGGKLLGCPLMVNQDGEYIIIGLIAIADDSTLGAIPMEDIFAEANGNLMEPSFGSDAPSSQPSSPNQPPSSPSQPPSSPSQPPSSPSQPPSSPSQPPSSPDGGGDEGGSGGFSIVKIGIIVVIIGAVVFFFTMKKGGSSNSVPTPMSQFPEDSVPPPTSPVLPMPGDSSMATMPIPASMDGGAEATATATDITGVGGVFDGNTFRIADKIAIGRDPRRCHLVFPAKAEGVSSLHCEVRRVGDSFELTDRGSTYGTFLSGGVKLEVNKAYPLRAGESFYLGSEKNKFIVG